MLRGIKGSLFPAMKIDVNARQRFRVPATHEEAFALLADVPQSYSHFPNLQRLVPLGSTEYRLEMEPISVAGVTHQVIYACRYTAKAGEGIVQWVPVARVGNGRIEGRWRLESDASGTHVEFETSGELHIEIPLLLRPMAPPFVQGLFRSEVGRYLDNIRRILGS
jgi:hypothetical protein